MISWSALIKLTDISYKALLEIGSSPFTVLLKFCRSALDDQSRRRNAFRNIDNVGDLPGGFNVWGGSHARFPAKTCDIFLPCRCRLKLDGFSGTCLDWRRRFRLRLGEVIGLSFSIFLKGAGDRRAPGGSDSRKIAVRLRRQQCCPYVLAQVFTAVIRTFAFGDHFLTVQPNGTLYFRDPVTNADTLSTPPAVISTAPP